MKLGEEMMRHKWHGEGIHQIQVTALNPQKSNQQIDFLEQDSNANISVKNKVIDLINEKYGNLTIAPSNIMNRSTMPDVIAPAWKPSGHRQTI
jgi:DNA polymerase-4